LNSKIKEAYFEKLQQVLNENLLADSIIGFGHVEKDGQGNFSP
jgi:hypothetical protein